MRLINVHNYKLETFLGSNIPPYAILSHTWGQNEVTFEQMPLEVRPAPQGISPEADPEAGYMKIIYTCKQAISDDLDYAWVDTCCIDKSSSAELTEAINSMFQWYHQAAFCYAYLSDIDHDINPPGTVDPEIIEGSKWFTRGWTLQELLAPMRLRFYLRGWKYVGNVTQLCKVIERRTGIERMYLMKDLSPLMCRHASVATRMSWAASRETTRLEDEAYCLLGIFDVNMPLLYGEGEKSFIRLQEEIMKVSDDETILAWNWMGTSSKTAGQSVHGFLAMSPLCFYDCQGLRPWPSSGGEANFSPTSRGLQVSLPIVHKSGDRYDAILRCNTKMDLDRAVTLPLVKLATSHGSLWDRVQHFSRSHEPTSVQFVGNDTLRSTTICISYRPWWPQIIHDTTHNTLSFVKGFYIRSLPAGCFITHTYPTHGWSPADNFAAMNATDDEHAPRYFFGSYSFERFVIRLRRVSGKWKSSIARRDFSSPFPPPLDEELAELTFSDHVWLMDRKMTISEKKEHVLGGILIVIDLGDRAEWMWEFGGVMLAVLGAGVGFAALGSLIGPKRRAR